MVTDEGSVRPAGNGSRIKFAMMLAMNMDKGNTTKDMTLKTIHDRTRRKQ